MSSINSLYDWLSGGRSRSYLKEKVVLITGASSGIGRQLAVDFYKYGAKVILAARRIDVLLNLKDELRSMNCNVYDPKILSLDLEKIDTIKDKAEEAVKMFGCVDILVNNAGMSVRGGCLETDISVHSRLMTVNYLGVVELTRHVVPDMLTRDSGHVLVISSVQGLLPTPWRSGYTASKHAVQAWADSLRSELCDTGVSVSVVSPGYVNTNLSRNALTSSGEKHGEMDSSTESGYSVEYVSDQVISCLLRQDCHLLLAPLYIRVAVILRTLLPALYRYIINKRALKEKKNQ